MLHSFADMDLTRKCQLRLLVAICPFCLYVPHLKLVGAHACIHLLMPTLLTNLIAYCVNMQHVRPASLRVLPSASVPPLLSC